MLDIVMSHLGMLVAMWAVLILVGASILVQVLLALRGSVNFDNLATAVTRPLLVDVLPLLVLSWLTVVDSTQILVRIWYYVAAAFIAVRALMTLASFLKR